MREQIANEVQKQQSSIGQTVTEAAGGVADVGSEIAVEVASEGIIDTAADVALGVGETVLGAAGELIGGLADGI